MNKTRLEAFSDGVLAIIITIMVLEFHPGQTNRIQNQRMIVNKEMQVSRRFSR